MVFNSKLSTSVSSPERCIFIQVILTIPGLIVTLTFNLRI